MNAPDRTLTKLRINPDWAKLPLLDRSKWQRVRFGDVVENINHTCDPAEAGIERFERHEQGFLTSLEFPSCSPRRGRAIRTSSSSASSPPTSTTS